MSFADFEISASMGELQQHLRHLHRRSLGLEDALRVSRAMGVAVEADNAELRQLLRGLQDRVLSLESQLSNTVAEEKPRAKSAARGGSSAPRSGAGAAAATRADTLEDELAVRRRSRFRAVGNGHVPGQPFAAQARANTRAGQAEGLANGREPRL